MEARTDRALRRLRELWPAAARIEGAIAVILALYLAAAVLFWQPGLRPPSGVEHVWYQDTSRWWAAAPLGVATLLAAYRASAKLYHNERRAASDRGISNLRLGKEIKSLKAQLDRKDERDALAALGRVHVEHAGKTLDVAGLFSAIGPCIGGGTITIHVFASILAGDWNVQVGEQISCEGKDTSVEAVAVMLLGHMTALGLLRPHNITHGNEVAYASFAFEELGNRLYRRLLAESDPTPSASHTS